MLVITKYCFWECMATLEWRGYGRQETTAKLSDELKSRWRRISRIRCKFYWNYRVQFSCSVVSNSATMDPRLPCPSTTPGTCSNSCPLSRWCHPTISSSVVPFSCPQSFRASGSFPMSQFFTSGSQSIGISASASVLPVNIQDWVLLGLTDLASLVS